MTIYSIYRVTNQVNGMIYIGYTKRNPVDRLKFHWRESKHTNNKFHNALKKYGLERFTLDILYQSTDGPHTQRVMEPFFIEQYDTFLGEGYNMTAGGEGFTGKHKKSTIEKCRKNANGFKKGHTPWNKNRTKADPEIAKMYENRRSSHTWKDNFAKTPEQKESQRQSAIKACVVEGIEYDSVKTAWKALGEDNIKYITLVKRIKSENFSDYYYV